MAKTAFLTPTGQMAIGNTDWTEADRSMFEAFHNGGLDLNYDVKDALAQRYAAVESELPPLTVYEFTSDGSISTFAIDAIVPGTPVSVFYNGSRMESRFYSYTSNPPAITIAFPLSQGDQVTIETIKAV